MKWFLIITLISISGHEPNLTQEIEQSSGPRCMVEKAKVEKSATPGGPYTQKVECVQK